MAAPKGQDVVQKAFEGICTRVIEEGISFKKAVDESDISLATFYKQLLKVEANKDLYNYAREIRSDYLFEEIIEIADTQEEGVSIKEKAIKVDGVEGLAYDVETKTGDMIEHRRLRVDARKWSVAKMAPKKYGDKLDLTTDNKPLQPTQPIQVVIDGVSLSASTLSVKSPENDTMIGKDE